MDISEYYVVVSILFGMTLWDNYRFKKKLDQIDKICFERFKEIDEMIKALEQHIYKIDESTVEMVKTDMLLDRKIGDIEQKQSDMEDDIEADRLKITDIDLDVQRLQEQPIVFGKGELHDS